MEVDINMEDEPQATTPIETMDKYSNIMYKEIRKARNLLLLEFIGMILPFYIVTAVLYLLKLVLNYSVEIGEVPLTNFLMPFVITNVISIASFVVGLRGYISCDISTIVVHWYLKIVDIGVGLFLLGGAIVYAFTLFGFTFFLLMYFIPALAILVRVCLSFVLTIFFCSVSIFMCCTRCMAKWLMKPKPMKQPKCWPKFCKTNNLFNDAFQVLVHKEICRVQFGTNLFERVPLGENLFQVLTGEIKLFCPMRSPTHGEHQFFKFNKVLLMCNVKSKRPIHDNTNPATIITVAGTQINVILLCKSHFHREMHIQIVFGNHVSQSFHCLLCLFYWNAPLANVLLEEAIKIGNRLHGSNLLSWFCK